MPCRNCKADKQGQISCLQRDKAQQKSHGKVHSIPSAGVREHQERAFFGTEEVVPMGQERGDSSFVRRAVVTGTDMRMDEAQGYGMGFARDNLQTHPR